MNVSELKRVGIEMAASGLPYEFVLRAVILSQDYEGIAGLLRMWAATEDANERDETVVAIQELIDDVEDAPRAVAVPARQDVDALIAARVTWKRQLRGRIEAAGGVVAVAKRAGIPQPSLSRLLGDVSAPRAGTLVRLAEALGVTVAELAGPRGR